MDGFIDDKTSLQEIDGIPVIKIHQVPEDALVVSAVIDGRPLTVRRILEDKGIEQIDFFSFYRQFSHRLKRPAWYHQPEFERDYIEQRPHYDAIRKRLADDLSLQTFDALINFRLTNSISCLSKFTCRIHEQYFDLQFISQFASHFVDCGSYDGETSLEFVRRFPDYKSVHVFEPEPAQFSLIKRRLADVKGSHLYPCGVSDSQQMMRFTSAGSVSKFSEDGDLSVAVECLDDLALGDVTWIKLDIEGYESQALAGAKNIIQQQHPLLAVCCYHKYDDLWKLPEQVLSYRQDYRIYLRHYTEGLLESVYYFVPVDSSGQVGL
ncbi:FkbM family methyltransferase [Lelliottia amnigena]|uniref:FkbM family methyltransferase n=1 Tax=Lelliottia amnigena TaxID=61646 RepID=UPI001C234B2E|nr:FkbM family methyltransferase [Lelliottia amnigena]QXB22217.1 FkbM family methyltransferase [Lelliottia amnigena]